MSKKKKKCGCWYGALWMDDRLCCFESDKEWFEKSSNRKTKFNYCPKCGVKL